MGTLKYGNADYDLDDRVLAHVRVVVVQKLRRKESFLLSWGHQAAGGGGRSSVWLTDGVPLAFTFFGSRSAALDREWLERLISASHAVMGLNLDDVPEVPVAEADGRSMRKNAQRSGDGAS
jgi:hypothetical protein